MTNMIIFLAQISCLLAFMTLQVSSTPYNPERPRFGVISANSQESRDSARFRGVNYLLEESKKPRSQTPRRYLVPEQDRRKYDLHRQGQHKFGMAEKIADHLMEKPIEKSANVHVNRQQKAQKHQTEQIRQMAKMGKERNAKAANALLPEEFRDRH